METDGKTLDLYNSRMAIPNSVLDTDTNVTLIPGFKEGWHSARIKDICFVTERGVLVEK